MSRVQHDYLHLPPDLAAAHRRTHAIRAILATLAFIARSAVIVGTLSVITLLLAGNLTGMVMVAP